MSILSIERTEEALVIKLPLDAATDEIQNLLNYLRYVNVGSKSDVQQQDIDALAIEAKSGWWEANKHRFEGKPGFEGFGE